MNKFGPIFENYVDKNLEYAGINFKSENELKNILGSDSKVVDFLSRENEKSILIDAKGVKMNYLGKVSHRPNIIKRKVKTSAVKGIKQAYETVATLRNENSNLVTNSNNNNYLLIITFKELYLGNGKVFEEAIGKEFINKLTATYGNEYLIPMENIYFLSIDSFEFWIEMIKQGKITMGKGLEKAIEDDQEPKTMKFDFMQHISKWKGANNGSPKFLKKRFESIFDSGLNVLN